MVVDVTITLEQRETGVSDELIEERMAFADAAMALAGHHVTDEPTRAIVRQVVGGAITGDEAVRLIIADLPISTL